MGTENLSLSLVRSLLQAYQKTNLRGQTVLMLLLARLIRSLQQVPIQIADWPPIYMNLCYLNAHPWFLGTPFASSPYEVNEQVVLRRFVRAGDVVFDVGANLGVHTVLLSRLVGSKGLVVSFEPNLQLLPMLNRTIAELGNTKLYPLALSDEEADSTLYVPDDHSMASLADWTKSRRAGVLTRMFGFGRTHTLNCRERRMDELISEEHLPLPNFIKCDVEGAELRVFKGGRNTLDRPDAPIILFEAGVESARGFDLEFTEAADFLTSLSQPGYRFLEVLAGGALREVRPADLKLPNQNIVAVPKTRSALCPELNAGSA